MGVHTFPKGICPKVNVMARLEYELAYYDSAVHRFNHYTTRTPPELGDPLVSQNLTAQSAGAADYTDCISQRVSWYMILNNLMEILGMWITPSLPSLPGPLWPVVVTPDRVPSVGQIELFDWVQANDRLHWIVKNRTIWSFNCV